MKKVFDLKAWCVDAIGNQTEITSEFDSDELKYDIIRSIQGYKATYHELDRNGTLCERKTSATVYGDGGIDLTIYETDEQYLKHKNRKGMGQFFNF